MKTIVFLIALLAGSLAGWGQELPDAPQPHRFMDRGNRVALKREASTRPLLPNPETCPTGGTP